ETLVIEAGDWREFSPRKVAVTAVDVRSNRMTTAESLDKLYTTHSEVVLNLPGIETMQMGGGTRPHYDLGQRGCMPVKYDSNEIGCYGPTRMTGAYKGGGFLSAAQGYPLEGCEAGKGTVTCTLDQEHGLGNFHSFPIRSLSGGMLSVGAEAHGWTKTGAVIIEGNSACNGIYLLADLPGANSAKLAQTGCSGAGGTVRRLYTGRFFELEGAGKDALEGVHLVDFPAPNQVRAFQVGPEAAAISAGGFVYTNPRVANFFMLRDVARLTWDRALFQMGHPFRVFALISVVNNKRPDIPCDCALLDSYVDGLHFWEPVTPGGGVVDTAQTYPVFSSIPSVYRDHLAHDVHIDGLTLRNSEGFGFFADQAGQPGPQDVTFRNISITVPRELIGGTHTKGLAYNMRHFIEVKGGSRLLLEDLRIENWPAVAVSSAAPIFFSYVANNPAPRLMQDIAIRNVFMRNVASGIALRGTNIHAFAAHRPIRRVLLDNLLIDGVDYPNLEGAPHGQTLGLPNAFFDTPVGAGAALIVGGPAEDVRITRVTARRLRSKGVPNFLWMMDDRVNHFQLDRSIFSFSPSGAEHNAIAMYDRSTRDLSPPAAGDGSAAFFAWTGRVDGADPQSWIGTPEAPVGVIPCLTESATRQPNFQGKNNVKSMAERAFACSGDDCSRWNVLLAGKDRQSCLEREALVLDKDIQGIGPFKGLGADSAELARALRYIPAQIMDVGPNSAKLVYRPLTQEACTVDHSRDPKFRAHIRGKDNGGPGDRAILLGGYKPGETAYYRLLCPQSVQIWGKFQTTPQ
ncbi:MAG: hypothetical protein KDC27_21300, partial [Acidobacteria bacterium]|nr:hypothetical protein [Acidobacteriota bacterium]